MNEFSTDSLKRYLIDDGAHLKPSSLGHRIRFIKSLFKWTHEEGHISKNPAAKLKEPKLGQRIPKFLSKHEIEDQRVRMPYSDGKCFILSFSTLLAAELEKLQN